MKLTGGDLNSIPRTNWNNNFLKATYMVFTSRNSSSMFFLIPCNQARYLTKFVEINSFVGCMDWPLLHLLKDLTSNSYPAQKLSKNGQKTNSLFWHGSNSRIFVDGKSYLVQFKIILTRPKHFVPSPNPFWSNPVGMIGHWHH